VSDEIWWTQFNNVSFILLQGFDDYSHVKKHIHGLIIQFIFKTPYCFDVVWF
jgi:YesN/AraC family two-component response regulator